MEKMENVKELIKKIDVVYYESKDKTDLFTPHHTKFICEVSYKKWSYHFTYQCNINYVKPTKEGLLACCLSDARCYEESITGKGEEENIQEFANLFGYDNDIIGLLKAYKGCKEAYTNTNKMFDKEEIEDLYEYFYEKGEI